jgi:hypothetical protein
MAVAQEIKIPLLRGFHEKCYDRCGGPCSPATLSCCMPFSKRASTGAAPLACQLCFVPLLHACHEKCCAGGGAPRLAVTFSLQGSRRC